MNCPSLCVSLSCNSLYRHCASVETTTLEHYNAIDECIECVILADANILARVVLCAALTYDNVASLYLLTTEMLKSESF